jgi:hypothetical protein
MPRRQPERKLQRQVWQHVVARLSSAAIIFHVPNGEWRGAYTGAILKSMGVVPGISDFIACRAGQMYALELKDSNGRLSDTQVETQQRLRDSGAVVATAYDLSEALRHLENWQILDGHTMLRGGLDPPPKPLSAKEFWSTRRGAATQRLLDAPSAGKSAPIAGLNFEDMLGGPAKGYDLAPPQDRRQVSSRLDSAAGRHRAG